MLSVPEIPPLLQTIETDGASAAVSFTIGDNVYVAVANYGSYGRYEAKSRLYWVMQDGNLVVVSPYIAVTH